MLPKKNKPRLIGRREYVDFPLLAISHAEAKIDTGAYTSSIHCRHIEQVNSNGKAVSYTHLDVYKRQADTYAHGFNAVAIKVEARDLLAEHFAQAVIAIWASRRVCVDEITLFVEAHRVVRARKNHALGAMNTRSFVQIVYAHHVGVQDRPPRPLDRNTAQMHDSLNAS